MKRPALRVPMRHLPPPADPASRPDLVRVADASLIETVYGKGRSD